MPQASLNPAQMQPVLKRIAHATGAEIVFKSNCFEMHGLEQQVRAACLMILDLDIVQVSSLCKVPRLLPSSG
jgi:hypothetical protein